MEGLGVSLGPFPGSANFAVTADVPDCDVAGREPARRNSRRVSLVRSVALPPALFSVDCIPSHFLHLVHKDRQQTGESSTKASTVLGGDGRTRWSLHICYNLASKHLLM